MIGDIFQGIIGIMTPLSIGAMALGVFTGLMFGAIPGISGIMAISILLPLTFYVDPLVGIPMLLGIYKASMYGGSITSILIGTPGDSSPPFCSTRLVRPQPSVRPWTGSPCISRASLAKR